MSYLDHCIETTWTPVTKDFGPDHDQYPLGVQLIADLDVQIGKIEAEIATLSK